MFPESLVGVVPAYFQKESFGDLDVVIESDYLPNSWQQMIIAELRLEPSELKKNSNTFSFKFEEIQVDLIATKSEVFDSSIDYFSYNDLNNLVGRICKHMGFKLGHEGLFLVVRPSGNDHEHIIEEILLTRDIRVAYRMIEISNPNHFCDGFETIEDIFKWVASSKYFNPDIFLLHNRNATSRVRDKKRKTYNAFLTWCEENKDSLPRHDFGSVDERGGYTIVEPFYSEIILKYFPEAKAKVDSAIAEYELNKEFKKIFNGSLITELTGLEGKELGAFICKIKPVFTDQQFYVDHSDLVIPIVERLYEKMKN